MFNEYVAKFIHHNFIIKKRFGYYLLAILVINIAAVLKLDYYTLFVYPL